jgi:uncharacterized membrane protein YdjX (TVP38/TMEM64 family)
MSLWGALVKRRGTRAWDAMLRGAGVAALLAIYPTMHSPEVAGMVAFLCITMFLHGPLAPLLPAAHEAVLMVTGRVYSPLLVAIVGIAGTLYMEYINYYVYRAALHHPRLEGTRQSKPVRATVAMFEKAPFFAVWMCSWSPLPYWAVRFLAPLSGYDVRRYLLATFLGRGPRYYAIALFGKLLPVSNVVLAVVTGVLIAVAVVIGMVQRARHRRSAQVPSSREAATV